MLKTYVSRPDSDTLRIQLAGKLLNGTENQFLEILSENGAREASKLLIDFAEVTFISSIGIHALNDLVSMRTPGLEEVALTRVSQTIKKMFKLTRMDRQFRIADD